MRQSDGGLRHLLENLEAGVVDVVVADVRRRGDEIERLRPAVAVAVRWTIEAVVAGDQPSPARLAPLRELAIEAARAGQGVGPLLDRYLSSGWALWEAVAGTTASAREDLTRIGARLLRAGDAAAAAIADAFAIAEGEVAARSGSARREFIDELLAYRPGDASLARLGRRAGSYGLAAGTAVRVLVVATSGELEDDDALVGQVARELGPRAILLATDRGRLLAVARSGVVADGLAARVLASAMRGSEWTAVVADVADGLTGIGLAVAEAHAALHVAIRLGLTGRIVPAGSIGLERALLADPPLLTAGIDAILGPLIRAPRTGGQLVETLRVFLETGGNRRETARRLGLAARTVTYRMARIEELLGTTLSGPIVLRLAAAILASDLLERDPSRGSVGRP